MKTLEYLNNLLAQTTFTTTKEEFSNHKDCLNKLNEEFGIEHSINENYPELVILNYSQINSSKFDQITRECRSLVLEMNDVGFKVVSRSFDRFYNYCEEQDKSYDITKMTAYEKVDGSLIGLFWYEKYGWLYRTRKMLMPTSSINGYDLTWKELIEETLGDLSLMKVNPYARLYTHIFEVVSSENRVVTRYNNKAAYLLACRENEDGSYLDYEELQVLVNSYDWKLPKQYKFSTFSECANAAKVLRDLEEGFVLYDEYNVPKVKVKNPAYVAAHLLRGEGLNPKRVWQLLFINEQDEYLTIFPEDREIFKPYIEVYGKLILDISNLFKIKNRIENQKEFALSIKDLPYAGILFTARSKKVDPIEVWNSSSESYKLKVVNTVKDFYK